MEDNIVNPYKEHLIRKVALLIFDGPHHIKLAKKRGNDTYILPGGKIEPGERTSEALVRKIREELGCKIDRMEFFEEYFGASSEPDTSIHLTVYVGETRQSMAFKQEIEHIRSINIYRPEVKLPPTIEFQLLPDIRLLDIREPDALLLDPEFRLRLPGTGAKMMCRK